MSAKTVLALIVPLSLEEFAAAAAAAVLLPLLITWLVMRGKLKRLERESTATLEKLRTDSGAAMQEEQAKAAAFAAESSKKSTEAAASFADLQQRFNTHREVAERRASDASRQISALEAELATTREVAAQLVPTQSRIKDLETALLAEQGRVKAQEQAIEATNARAADFEKRMLDAKDMVLKHKEEMQETAVELKKIRDEQAAYAAAGGPEAELAKAKEATQQAEVKIANLQRALKAAEARTEMVQKEFMTAVGVATAPTPGMPATHQTDKKLREQEEKLVQLEAESRKRAREDGYKIAELEYRLSEALEAAKQSQAKLEPVASAPSPAEPVHVPAVIDAALIVQTLPSIETAPAVPSSEAAQPVVESPAPSFVPEAPAEPALPQPAQAEAAPAASEAPMA